LTDNLAAKLLISINVLIPEKVNIIIFKKARHIRSCKIDIKLKATPKKGIKKLLVCVIARITILLFAFIAILIYYIIIAKDKDLLFKPDNMLVTLFI
jgi:lipopolysaccharide/colanic/teichoic acid biosynthesis glycosyltransferase